MPDKWNQLATLKTRTGRHGATADARRGRGAPAQLHMQLRATCSAAAPAPSLLHLVQQVAHD
eukprot:1577431-Prymnesium_polylepis.1